MAVKIVKSLWIGVMAIVLIITLISFDGTTNSDIGVFLAWTGLLLSIPAGLLVPLIHVGLYEGLTITIGTSYVSLVLDWVGFFILGYLQWFKFLPYLINRWRTHRSIEPSADN